MTRTTLFEEYNIKLNDILEEIQNYKEASHVVQKFVLKAFDNLNFKEIDARLIKERAEQFFKKCIYCNVTDRDKFAKVTLIDFNDNVMICKTCSISIAKVLINTDEEVREYAVNELKIKETA